MNNNRGYTLVEIISVIAIIAVISGIFVLSFMKKNNNQLDENYNNEISKLEAASDSFVMTYKDSDDENFKIIKYTAGSLSETYCYITIDELVKYGFLNQVPINPKTNVEFTGVIKFTKKENGLYDFKYIDESNNYVLVIYNANGADSVSKKIEAIPCESKEREDVINCTKDYVLPTIERENGRVHGWSLNKDSDDSEYKAGMPLMSLLKNSDFSLNDNKLYLYAISEGIKTVTWVNMNDEEYEKSCVLKNDTRYCEIEIPENAIESTDDYKELSDCTNSKYDIKENNGKITVSNNERLECKYDIKDLEIKENKIKKVSSIESVEANMNLILVLDVSGSMSSYNRLNNLKVVTKEMVNKIKLNNSTVSIITFNHNASTVLSLETDRNKINTVIDSLVSSGGTSFKVAISQTSLLLSKITNNKSNYVIFLSDGDSADDPLYNNLSFVKMNSKVYTIGIGKAIASQLLNISSSSDNYYSYDDVNDESSLQSLFAIFDDIIQNITTEYGSGAENATDGVAKKGYLVLGKNAISKNNSVEIYYNDTLLDKFITVNKYIEFDGNNYLMNVYQYAIDHNIAYSDVGNLRFSYIFEEGAA